MTRRRVHEHDGVLLDISEGVIGPRIRRAVSEEWYERHEAELIERHLPAKTDVIELGAGIGYISCVIDRALDGTATHVALEPNPQVVPVLECTKRLNDATYIVCERAYSAHGAEVTLDQPGEYWDATTGPARRGGIDVPTTDLAGIRERYGMPTFALVADIEGAEYELLVSELDVLEAYCSWLIVEFHEEGPYADAYDTQIEQSVFELVDGIEDVCVYRNERIAGGSRRSK